MDFEKYIEKLKKAYTVEDTGNKVYRISKNGREILTSPNRMFEDDFLCDFFNVAPLRQTHKQDNYFSREVLGEEDLTIRRNTYFLDDRIEGSFGRVGEDDLLPNVSHKNLLNNKKGKIRGPLADPKSDFFMPENEDSSEDSPMIKKDPISPLHGKKGPDPDHFKKPGSDDDLNKFFY